MQSLFAKVWTTSNKWNLLERFCTRYREWRWMPSEIMSVTKIIEKNFMIPVSFNGMFFIVFGGTHDAHARHSCLSNRLCARLCRWI
jgi:hypothetical protein